MTATRTDRMWSLTRSRILPADMRGRAWRVIVTEPRDTVSGPRYGTMQTVHTIGYVFSDDIPGEWACRYVGDRTTITTGRFPTRSAAAQCLFDDWNVTAATHRITAKIRAARDGVKR